MKRLLIMAITAAWALALPLIVTSNAARAGAMAPLTCTHVRQEQVWGGGGGDYSRVEWTSNSCGWLTQDRSECRNAQVQTAYFKGGPVKSLYVWSTAACTSTYPQIIKAQDRISTDGGATWSSWVTYWQL